MAAGCSVRARHESSESVINMQPLCFNHSSFPGFPHSLKEEESVIFRQQQTEKRIEVSERSGSSYIHTVRAGLEMNVGNVCDLLFRLKGC